MNSKQIISIALKIVGIIAFWTAVKTFPGLISAFGIFSSMLSMNNFMHGGGAFMFFIAISAILNFVLPLAVAYVFILKTEILLPYFGLNNEDEFNLNLGKIVIYKLVIIVFAFIAILNGANNFLTYNYNTNTNTEYITNNTNLNQPAAIANQQKVTTTQSKAKNVNYFALAEIIIGIILLSKVKKYAGKIELIFSEPELIKDNNSTN